MAAQSIKSKHRLSLRYVNAFFLHLLNAAVQDRNATAGGASDHAGDDGRCHKWRAVSPRPGSLPLGPMQDSDRGCIAT